MDKDKLREIIESHGRWLRNEGGSRANLSGANLRDANLRRADLRDADLSRANLSGVDLSGANLSGANLRDANLSRANLSGVDLSGANLSDKILQVGPIGSRRSYTVYNVTKDVVQCGCWGNYKGGTLAEFETRVNDVYSADSTYGNEYRRVIAWFKTEREAIHGGKL